jgi:hypothetical protein
VYRKIEGSFGAVAVRRWWFVVGRWQNQLPSHGRLFRAGFLFFFGFPKYCAITAVNLILPTTND